MINKKNLLLSMVSTAIFFGGINTASAAASFHLSANDVANTSIADDAIGAIEGDTVFTGAADRTADIAFTARADGKILPSYVFTTHDPGTLIVTGTTDLHVVNLNGNGLTVTGITGTPKSLTLYAMQAEAAIFTFTTPLTEAQTKVTKYKIGPISVTARP